MVKTIRDIWLKRSILRFFVSAQLTSSYRTKSLGFFWALLDPLLFMGVYFVVFGLIIAHRPPDFMLHIFIGVIAFRFLSTSASQSGEIVRGQAGLIREIAFPKALLPISVVSARLFDYAAGWVVAVPLGLLFHVYPTGYWLLIPVLVLIQALFTVGFSLLTGYIGVFFADVHNILDVLLRLWFYMSPVLYYLHDIQTKAEAAGAPFYYYLYLANPMASLLHSFESVTVDAELPHLVFVGYAAVIGLTVFLLGIYVFSRAEGEIGKYV
jgi:ABC-type polysaccharide/polyol phosphate export permease